MSSQADIDNHNAHLRSLRHIDHSKLPFTPIPDGQDTCSVSLLRGGYGRIPTLAFIVNDDGSAPGGPDVDPAPPVPVFGFLIERSNGQKVIFDLGLRPANNWTKPEYQAMVANWSFDAYDGRGIPEILSTSAIPLSSISSILLGHAHIDHVGDLRPFPPSTSLVVGPDSPPLLKLAELFDVPLKTLEEREVRYLDRKEEGWVDVGCFKGYDLWKDGSLYLLDVPGHTPGHMSALVRTSINPPTFFMLGSDVAHNIGLISPHVPPQISRPLVGFTDMHGPGAPLWCFHESLEEAYVSIGKAARMEEEASVCVLLAHDRSIDLVIGEGGIVPLKGTREEIETLKARKRDVFW